MYFHQYTDFKNAGDNLSAAYHRVTTAMDPFLGEVLSEYYYDNTPADLFRTLPDNANSAAMREAHARLPSINIWRNLNETGGDECLGLAYAFMRKGRDFLSNANNLKRLYDVDTSKPINIQDATDNEDCHFKISFSTNDGRAIKIKLYLVGFLSNTPLPYYHYASMIKVVEQSNEKRKIFFMADPGEGMTRLYSHVEERDVGSGRGRIVSLDAKRELFTTPYYEWLAESPAMRERIAKYGQCAEGFWRRNQCVVFINKAIPLSQLQKEHAKLYSFLLLPKIVKFDQAGKAVAYVLWDFMKQRVTLKDGTTVYKLSQAEFLKMVQSHDPASPYALFLNNWENIGIREGIAQKVSLVMHHSDRFYCTMVDANRLRQGIKESVEQALHESASNCNQSTFDLGDALSANQPPTHQGTVSPLLFREFDGEPETPAFVKTIVEERKSRLRKG